ncbi:hypothetical protein PUN28_002530 [Cardiocondyla obscurior]|uniref:H15 domain-containing protein n=1 Tax=Cardiocondyla obscurior TaxID=286306 RepID=A0AAW2GUN5_9HYME
MTKQNLQALVASAIRNLREIRGSTSKEIISYIKSQYAGSETNIQKQIQAALKRGLNYGVLKRDGRYYSLSTDPDVIYKAHTVAPMEQGRRRRRRRRRGRGVSRRRSRRGRKSRMGGRSRGRGRGKGRRRRRRRSRSARSTGGGGSPLPRSRSLTARCNCMTRKHAEDTLESLPVENLRKDMAYSCNKNIVNQTPSRHQSHSRDRSQSSLSSSSDKEMIENRNRDQS